MTDFFKSGNLFNGTETITLSSEKNAILALVTKSANDVATAIAENISGSERAFALTMTEKLVNWA